MPLVRSIVRKIWEMRSRAEEATQKKARRVRRIKPMEARKRQRQEKSGHQPERPAGGCVDMEKYEDGKG